MKQESSATELIRAYSLVRGTVTKKEASLDLGLSIDKVKYAFTSLINQGYLRKVRHGLYQFVATVEKPPQEKTDRIWRAMGTQTVFTASVIAKLADTTTSYVYKLFYGFRDAGYIKHAGRKSTIKGGSEQAWRLTLSGKRKALKPNEAVYQPDPIVPAALTLCFMVGTRVALRNPWAAKQALKLIDQIKNGLEDVAAS